jgi:hypothetical protein
MPRKRRRGGSGSEDEANEPDYHEDDDEEEELSEEAASDASEPSGGGGRRRPRRKAAVGDGAAGDSSGSDAEYARRLDREVNGLRSRQQRQARQKQEHWFLPAGASGRAYFWQLMGVAHARTGQCPWLTSCRCAEVLPCFWQIPQCKVCSYS